MRSTTAHVDKATSQTGCSQSNKKILLPFGSGVEYYLQTLLSPVRAMGSDPFFFLSGLLLDLLIPVLPDEPGMHLLSGTLLCMAAPLHA
jgi:hypothetical protein